MTGVGPHPQMRTLGSVPVVAVLDRHDAVAMCGNDIPTATRRRDNTNIHEGVRTPGLLVQLLRRHGSASL
jgi:hypothetical protein